MASDVKQVSNPFTATGAGPVLNYANGRVSVYLAGTFTGTIQLQAQNNANPVGYVPVIPNGSTSANLTAAGLYEFGPVAGDFSFRLECTAFTSGPIQTTLAACPQV